MRNRPNTFEQTPRTISASVQVYETEMPFHEFLMAENLPGTPEFYDDEMYQGKLLRVATVGMSVYGQYVGPADGGWLNPTWTLIGTIPASQYGEDNVAVRCVTIGGNRAFVHTHKTLYYFDYTVGSGWSAIQDNYLWASTVGFAAPTPEINDLWRMTLDTETERAFISHMAGPGYLNGITEAVKMDVIRLNGIDWFFMENAPGKRPLYMYSDGITSAPTSILPMDSADAENQFKLGGVSNVGNSLIVTGTIKRQYGDTFAVFLQGPERLTTGREYIIAKTNKLGKLYDFNDGYLWYVGYNCRYRANKTMLLGNINPRITIQNLENVTVDESANAPAPLTMQLPENLLPQFTPGSELHFYVNCNGVNYRQGIYGVDSITNDTNLNGKAGQVQAVSMAMKRLKDWKADTYYDFYSQSHVFVEPANMGQVIRQNGKFGTADGKFGSMDLNINGLMYTSLPACEGGMVMLKFTKSSDRVHVGAGVGYAEESIAECAKRLSKATEEIKNSDRMRRGVLAIFYSAPNTGANDSIAIMQYSSQGTDINNMVGVASSPFILGMENWTQDLPVGTVCWIGLICQNGHATAYFRRDTDVAWVKVCSGQLCNEYAYIHPELYSPRTDGRGVVYMRNVTPYTYSFPFLSDSKLIPLQYDDDILSEKFPADDVSYLEAPGTVLVDSEQIRYTNAKYYPSGSGVIKRPYRFGKRATWSIGDVADARPGGPAYAGEVMFAQSRNNNYAIQIITVQATCWITSFKFWLKKVGDPEDGVEVSIWQDPRTEANPLGVEIVETRTTIPPEAISRDGGPVMAVFHSAVQLEPNTPYYVVIKRSKNPTHPNGENYFVFNTCTGGYFYPSYVFEEIGDTWIAQAHPMAFQLFVRIEEPGGKAPICAAWTDWMSDLVDEYKDMALIISDGKGKGDIYQVVGSRRIDDPIVLVFYVDPPPPDTYDAYDETSIVEIVPCLYGLTRGYNDTVASAHSDFSRVDTVMPVPGAHLAELRFFTSDMDLSIHDLAAEIARKAGVEEISSKNLITSPIANGVSSELVTRKNVIADVHIPATMADGASLSFDFRLPETLGDDNKWGRVTLSRSADRCYITLEIHQWDGGAYQVVSSERFEQPFEYNPLYKGKIRFSVTGDRASLWWNRWLMPCFKLPTLNGTQFKINNNTGQSVTASVYEACTRVDNFSIDMGKSGVQLLAKLIGQKQVFYQDDGSGKLRLYIARTDTNSEGTPERRAISYRTTKIDAVPNRYLLEGGEVVEVSDVGNFKRGNFFELVNINEINTLEDAEYFAQILLEEAALNQQQVEIILPGDPLYEPGDRAYFQFPGETLRMVVDTVSHQIVVSMDTLEYTTRITGRAK